SDEKDFFRTIGRPNSYKNCRSDCEKFFALFREARASLDAQVESRIFDLSTVFLAIRNFATCFSLGTLVIPDFSRNSALRLGVFSLSISTNAYEILERSRILCTRAIGAPITDQEAQLAIRQFPQVNGWMTRLLKKVSKHAA